MGMCQSVSVCCEKMKSELSLVNVFGFFLYIVHWVWAFFFFLNSSN